MSPILNNTDDDLTLRTRRAAAAERSSVDRGDSASADREVTLNTGMVLALFFALALICAVFFGFGYSMGRKSGQAAPIENAAASSAADTDSGSSASAAKPSAVPPAAPQVPGYVAQGNTSGASERTSAAETKAMATVKPPAATVAGNTPAPTTHVPAPTPVVIPPVSKPPAASAAAAPAQPGMTYVQVAAVSHQEDADVLVSALRRRGYTVLARTNDTDHLIHVQIGPFGNRKDGEAMRQKLLGDGYNAFLK